MNSIGDTEVAVLLGSGLGGAADGFPAKGSIRFEEVAGLTAPGVEGHQGEFRLCRVSGRNCLFILGRRHHYEEADGEIVEIVRFASSFGAKKLIVVSAAGSVNRHIVPGEFVLVDRLLDLQMRPPVDTSGKFPPECIYNESPALDAHGGRNFLSIDGMLMRGIENAAGNIGIPIRRGTAACMPGPAYETAAEVSMLQTIGADLAAMSAAAEVIYANRLGMRAAVLCLVTNDATGISKKRLTHRDVLAVGGGAYASLSRLLAEWMRDG